MCSHLRYHEAAWQGNGETWAAAWSQLWRHVCQSLRLLDNPFRDRRAFAVHTWFFSEVGHLFEPRPNTGPHTLDSDLKSFVLVYLKIWSSAQIRIVHWLCFASTDNAWDSLVLLVVRALHRFHASSNILFVALWVWWNVKVNPTACHDRDHNLAKGVAMEERPVIGHFTTHWLVGVWRLTQVTKCVGELTQRTAPVVCPKPRGAPWSMGSRWSEMFQSKERADRSLQDSRLKSGIHSQVQPSSEVRKEPWDMSKEPSWSTSFVSFKNLSIFKNLLSIILCFPVMRNRMLSEFSCTSDTAQKYFAVQLFISISWCLCWIKAVVYYPLVLRFLPFLKHG